MADNDYLSEPLRDENGRPVYPVAPVRQNPVDRAAKLIPGGLRELLQSQPSSQKEESVDDLVELAPDDEEYLFGTEDEMIDTDSDNYGIEMSEKAEEYLLGTGGIENQDAGIDEMLEVPVIDEDFPNNKKKKPNYRYSVNPSSRQRPVRPRPFTDPGLRGTR